MSGEFVEIHYSPKMEQFYALNGHETFYNDQDYMLFWDTLEEVQKWLEEHQPGLIILPYKETISSKPLQSLQDNGIVEASGNGAETAPEV